MLSFVGHSPTFAVRQFAGWARVDGDPISRLAIEVKVEADSLDLLDQVSPGDRREIEERMRKDVLGTTRFPTIIYDASEAAVSPIGVERYRLRIPGELWLHGISHSHPIDAELNVSPREIGLVGTSSLRLSDYGIKPVTALGGTIRLKDDLKVSFEVVGVPEGS
jgi:polyisoprenoid-binding protein YceI